MNPLVPYLEYYQKMTLTCIRNPLCHMKLSPH